MKGEIKSFTFIDNYGCIHIIYGVDYYDAVKNYEESLVFKEEDE